ncbi:MAG: 3-oxoacyl-[acyl-carrier-protein] synthase [Blastocatellia bacterium]
MVTPLGLNAPSSIAAIRASLSAFAEIPWMIDQNGEPMIVGRLELLDDCFGLERLESLAIPAARECMQDYADRFSRLRLPALALSLPKWGDWSSTSTISAFLNNFEQGVGITFDAQRRKVFFGDRCSGMVALKTAFEWISRGEADFCLVGGVDSYIEAERLEEIDAAKRLHSSSNPHGFIPGEAAAFILIGRHDLRSRSDRSPQVIFRACAIEVEPHPFGSGQPCLAQGLTNSCREALSAMAIHEQIDWILCDMNGEPEWANEWAYAYIRSREKYVDPLNIWHPADCIGDVGAATGAVLSAIAFSCYKQMCAPGRNLLIWTAGDAPERAASLWVGG